MQWLERSQRKHRMQIVVSAEDSQHAAGVEVTTEWKLERVKAMLVFMGPALILPLSDPLMSLIDAICLGRVRPHLHFVPPGTASHTPHHEQWAQY